MGLPRFSDTTLALRLMQTSGLPLFWSIRPLCHLRLQPLQLWFTEFY